MHYPINVSAYKPDPHQCPIFNCISLSNQSTICLALSVMDTRSPLIVSNLIKNSFSLLRKDVWAALVRSPELKDPEYIGTSLTPSPFLETALETGNIPFVRQYLCWGRWRYNKCECHNHSTFIAFCCTFRHAFTVIYRQEWSISIPAAI